MSEQSLRDNTVYQFPANVRATDATIEAQTEYALGEVEELKEAVYCGHNEMHIIEECWDVIQSVEGILRKFPAPLVESVFIAVYEKCKARGNYEDE